VLRRNPDYPDSGITDAEQAWMVEHLGHSKTLDDVFNENLCYKGRCPEWYVWMRT